MPSATMEPPAHASLLNVEKEQLKEIQNPVVATPDFVSQIHQDFLAQSAHCFIVSGNVFDYMDPMGARMFILDVLGAQFDTSVKKNNAEFAKKLGYRMTVKDKTTQVLAFYEAGRGLSFLTSGSKEEFQDFMEKAYSEEERLANSIGLAPQTFGGVMDTLNWYFKVSRERRLHNQAVVEATGNPSDPEMKKELNFTIVFMDAPFFVPAGDISHMDADRQFLAQVRSWSRDLELGNRNKIIFVTPSLAEVNEAIRSSDSFIKHITIKKPNLDARKTWLNRYNDNLAQQAAAGAPQMVNGRPWTKIELAEGDTLEDIAIDSAGLNFKQLEGPIVATAIQGIPISRAVVKSVKQDILKMEYGGLLEFVEPVTSFNSIGGHDHLKRYFDERIINPLRKHQRDICSDGLVMTGPAGTGKTALAMAAAHHAGVSFLIGHMDKLKDKFVGNSEKMMANFLAGVKSAAPCILFLDEIESVWGKHGRTGSGDGGVQNGQFNAFMQFASDPWRKGQIVLVAATNRPDLLDDALIRPGRFEDMLPCLPPKPGDWAGKLSILFAVMNSRGKKFDPTLKFTAEEEVNGPSQTHPLASLAYDKRYWTGAEIVKLVSDMILNAQLAEELRKEEAGRKYQFRITAEDIRAALFNVLPKTGSMQAMIGLSLGYMNNRRYTPAGWEKDLDSSDTLKLAKDTYGSTVSFDRE